MRMSIIKTLITLAVVCGAMLWGQASQASVVSPKASFKWLTKLPGDQLSVVNAISDDGSTVVGTSYSNPNSPTGVTRAFRWTTSGGFQTIGDLPGGIQASQAVGVSGDGSVVVGSSSSALSYSHHPYYHEPFKWSVSEGISGLGYLPGTNGQYGGAEAISGNGKVVVGSSSGNNGAKPFRWSQETGMVTLGDLDSSQGNQDSAFGVNSDGTVIVGMSQLGWDRTAFRWTPGAGMQSLGSLLTPASGDREKFSAARDTSEDGAVVVGSAYTDDGGIEAFRWTPGGGMQGIGKLPNAASLYSDAAAISADGKVIVGSASDAGWQSRAIIWTAAGTMRLLEDLLVEQGAGPIIGGGSLMTAVDISADGRTIVGTGYGPVGQEMWVATLVPEPGVGAMILGGVLVLCRRRGGGSSFQRYR